MSLLRNCWFEIRATMLLEYNLNLRRKKTMAKYDPIITELGVQKSQLQQRLKELNDLIAEADRTIESLKF